MTTFILYIATSLDGYIAKADGSIDWLPVPESEADQGYAEFYASVDALVMGAATYEQVLGFGDWPYPGKPTYVLTQRDRTAPRADIRFCQSMSALLAATEPYQRVWLVGGGWLASAFMQQNLVDEYVVTLVPRILGTGISLYQSVPEIELELVSAIPGALGLVTLHYQRAKQS
ncbi:dihydrofolate reductase family protein [Sphaerothrix gracilis]|uniref:dihydrofolate reductase family protein n=1 Tax=Sphaerothrix gracilis TaxID=3151835 RepID=UPI0031FC978A